MTFRALLRLAAIVFALSITTLVYANSDARRNNSTKPGNNQIDRLFDQLQTAPDQKYAREVENEIWTYWMGQPTDPIRALVKKAMEKRRGYDFEGARLILNKVTMQAPEYAEGWNQRAFVLFLQEKYDQSLTDLERALELEPRHFGALAGQARILLNQGRFKAGQKILKQAVKIHPYLRERSMIVDTGEKDI